jgi:transposase
VVGVDDFAWTKRRSSGTILVDLEAHRLLALLADCEGDTVAAWFRRHPSVQIVTRDRSPTFADARRRGAPHALHIADRFHLHMNAMTCLETLLTREQATLRRVAATLRAEHRKAPPAPLPKPLAPQRQRGERRARRYGLYEQVVQRHPRKAGHSGRLRRKPGCIRRRWRSISKPGSFLNVLLTRSADA